jgi:hypothetical protein
LLDLDWGLFQKVNKVSQVPVVQACHPKQHKRLKSGELQFQASLVKVHKTPSQQEKSWA